MPYMNDTTGKVTLSLEIELGWGKHDLAEYDHLSTDMTVEIKTLTKLLELCDRLGIPMSFSIVGHLLENSCPGYHHGPYPEEWWREDPGTNENIDPQFYNPDIIELIKDTDVDHEIATHTYSHIHCEEVPEETLAFELDRVATIYSDLGIDSPRSIVFPKHQTNHYSTIQQHDIEVVRQPIENYNTLDKNPLKKFYSLLNRSHPTTGIKKENDLIETCCTPHPSLTATHLPNGQRSPHPAFQIIPLRVRQQLQREYIKSAVSEAANQGRYIHLWTHLHNLSNQYQWPPVHKGMKHIAKLRDQGEIELFRMRDLAGQVSSSKDTMGV